MAAQTPDQLLAQQKQQLQQGMADAKSVYQPLTDAQNKLTQDQFNTLKQNIGVQKNQAIEGVKTTLAGRGFGRDSGELGWDTAQIEQQAQQSLNTANIQQTVQQAQQNLQNWQQITSAASQQQQTQFAQQQQAIQSSLQQHQQTLSNLGIPIQNFKTTADVIQGFLNSGTDITGQYPEIWTGLMESINKQSDAVNAGGQ